MLLLLVVVVVVIESEHFLVSLDVQCARLMEDRGKRTSAQHHNEINNSWILKRKLYLFVDTLKYVFTHAIYYSENVVTLNRIEGPPGLPQNMHALDIGDGTCRGVSFTQNIKKKLNVPNSARTAPKKSREIFHLQFIIHFSWLIIFSWIFFALNGDNGMCFGSVWWECWRWQRSTD